MPPAKRKSNGGENQQSKAKANKIAKQNEKTKAFAPSLEKLLSWFFGDVYLVVLPMDVWSKKWHWKPLFLGLVRFKTVVLAVGGAHHYLAKILETKDFVETCNHGDVGFHEPDK